MKVKTAVLLIGLIIVISICIALDFLNTSFFMEDGYIKYIAIVITPIAGIVFTVIALIGNTKNNQQNSSDNKFNLLLTQHNIQLENVKLYLEKNKNNANEKSTLTNCIDYEITNNHLFQHSVFSPYMRVLYHTLKNIYIDSKIIGNDLSYEKKYSSLVRSLIRNDILYFIAINSLSDKNADFDPYRKLLIRYNFFEHLNTTGSLHAEYENYYINNFNLTLNNIKKTLKKRLIFLIENILTEKNKLLTAVFSKNNNDALKIPTPTLYRLYYIFNKKQFDSHYQQLKNLILNLTKKNEILMICDNIKKNKKHKYNYYYLAEMTFTKNCSYSYSLTPTNKRTYLIDELAKIKNNNESFEDFKERFNTENNYDCNYLIHKNKINNEYDIVTIDDFYKSILMYEASTILNSNFENIYQEAVSILKSELKSQNIISQQGSNIFTS
ncbi:hypothetical protein ISO70_03540 [Morganella morganii subsp. morganii]|uniref:hypothetical protein n=1 Tax=Morganella morganii TaxID=582 RepID=UPI001BD9F507|nr:hypothetical protein [Morganella morganii]MBT0351727.1 hypothetical protein [Morganella morganii subsp. morganii]